MCSSDLSLPHADFSLEALHEKPRAAHEACGSQADFHNVPPDRLQAEGVVETRHPENVGHRDLQADRHVFQNGAGEIAAVVVDVLQDRDQRSRIPVVSGKDAVDPGLVVDGQRFRGPE